MSACFGVGMVAGPAGDCWAPSFACTGLAAAVLNGPQPYYWLLPNAGVALSERRPMPLRAFNPKPAPSGGRGA